MPLNQGDVQYLNKVLERQIRDQLPWPWLRYFNLGFAAIFIGVGLWELFWMTSSMAAFDKSYLQDIERRTSATSRSPADTQPVTYAMLKTAQDTIELRTRMDTTAKVTLMVWYSAVILQLCIGIGIGMHTLGRWNRHRRDAILITLLREKCAAELAEPKAS